MGYKMLWLVALLVSSIFAILAFLTKSLTTSGMIAAIFVGTSILGGTGWLGFMILAFFFISSNVLGKLSRVWNQPKLDRIVKKGEQRDAFQVLANGGFASVTALGYTWLHDPTWLIAMCASLGAATADTWASEIGRRSTSAPFHILSWQRVEQGTSGAITPLGTGASFLGAVITALVSIPLLVQQNVSMSISLAALFILLAGWLGNWVDTVVGAKWQVLYQCPICQQYTEKEICHKETTPCKGIRWINNDVVNALCTISAGAIASLVYQSYYFWQG